MSKAYLPSYRIERVDAARWATLRPEWERLHAQLVGPTFFLSPTWVQAWLDHYAGDLRPQFIRIEDAGRLVGIALLSRRTLQRGPFRLAQWHLNTSGEGPDSPMLEHNALLCAPTDRALVAAAVGELLQVEPWDELIISGVRRADFEALAACCVGTPAVDWRESPYVDLVHLRAHGAVYLDALSRNTRQQIRRSMSLYETRGRLELHAATDLDQARDWFNQLVELHQGIWRARGKPGAFASPRQRAFHDRIIETGLPRGEVQLLKIGCGAETIGILYNLCHSGHISYYQSGFRYEDDNRLKPGLVCHALAIQRALDDGFREYDFLAAANDGARYKQSLSNANRQFGWAVYRRRGFKISAIDALARLRGRWRPQ